METVAFNFHDEDNSCFGKIKLCAGIFFLILWLFSRLLLFYWNFQIFISPPPPMINKIREREKRKTHNKNIKKDCFNFWVYFESLHANILTLYFMITCKIAGFKRGIMPGCLSKIIIFIHIFSSDSMDVFSCHFINIHTDDRLLLVPVHGALCFDNWIFNCLLKIIGPYLSKDVWQIYELRTQRYF